MTHRFEEEQHDTDSAIGEVEKTQDGEAPLRTSATTARRTNLVDMPEDIIHEIAAWVLGTAHPNGRYLRHLFVNPYEYEYEYLDLREEGLEDLLVFSSCCKWQRNLIFPVWIMRHLVVRISQKEWHGLEILPVELRQEVR